MTERSRCRNCRQVVPRGAACCERPNQMPESDDWRLYQTLLSQAEDGEKVVQAQRDRAASLAASWGWEGA